ncbi:hypothetical protein ACQPUL_05590 [Clostridium butyricum]|uniref:hypothetical protein n=1 Tax=Clostridium TaxID=1485 RepID=UPI0029035C81|nr:hypothetical protein [Clostridium sp.]MDU1232615.1 hypothetical protein [Clostridium sp.]MDU2894461.1 hypothetical protein [Clostridium sp.]MDU3006269.1 hypothetical protein [Clostridium sp.]MDU3036194.1 hypothetical protein [Clostridium sp.]MDU3050151.1 hypothetical protein [Clostridium sp.]
MFYQELYQYYNEQSNELIKELIISVDKFIALLPQNQQDKITVGKVASKLKIDYNISRGILEKLTELNILVRVFGIQCPSCGFILKYSDEEHLYQDIIEVKSHNICYSCEVDIEDIAAENIEVRYKVVKKPDNDPNNIKQDILNMFDLKDKSLKRDNLNDIVKKANYDSNNLFYDPTEEQYEKLNMLFCGVFRADTSKKKGDSLEYFAEYLLNLIKPVTATKFARTPTNQLDTYAVNKATINGLTKMNPVLQKIGHTFICECKNENKKPENGYFGKLATELMNSRTHPSIERFGIIFSKKSPPKTYLVMAKKTFDRNKASIITFYEDELREIVEDRVNLLAYIDYKLALIHEDLLESEAVKSLYI